MDPVTPPQRDNPRPTVASPTTNAAISDQKSWKNMDPEQKKKVGLITGGVILVLALIGGGMFAFLRPKPTPPPTVSTFVPTPTPLPTPTPVPVEMASNLDGVIVPTEAAIRHPLAIMVENTTDARPQTGLTQASIVYEAIVEGGITRYMAVFSHDLPDKVGPVRSARNVFIDFAEEYQPKSAYYAHVGGAPQALAKIKGDGVYDLDQFGVGTAAYQRFPRAGVATEHTMFTFPTKLYDVVKKRGYSQDSNFQTWKFKDNTDITNRPETQTISIPFSSPTYAVKYVYDKASNSYKRYLANAEHKDANGGSQLSPKNVIVEFVNYNTIANDPKGRQDVAVIGTGNAKIFIDGKVIDAKWQKDHSPSRTIYTDAATGKEIEFNRGQFFIELVKLDSKVTIQ